MNKTVYIIVTLALLVGIGIIFSGGKNVAQPTQVVEVKDGVQYITIDAKGGYSPQITEAKAGIPSKLVVKTDGTYDCSASLAIPSLGFQKILAQTGEEVIDIGIPKMGEPLKGVCGMGMYNFQINFN
jgi:plastocyanin domain-containing protein